MKLEFLLLLSLTVFGSAQAAVSKSYAQLVEGFVIGMAPEQKKTTCHTQVVQLGYAFDTVELIINDIFRNPYHYDTYIFLKRLK